MTGMAGKETDYAENGWSYLLDYWILPQLKSQFVEHLYGTQVCGVLYPFIELTTYFFLRCLSHQFSSHVLSKILTLQFIHWLQSIKQWTIIILLFILSNKKYDHVYCLKFCPVWRFLFASVFQGRPRKESQCYRCTTLGGACITRITISKPGPSLLFFGQLILGKTLWGNSCIPGSRQHCSGSRNHGHLGNFFI